MGAMAAVTLTGIQTHAQATQFLAGEEGDLWMYGEIVSTTGSQLQAALDANPGTQWIVMHYVPGSDDDRGIIDSARIIRERGLNTVIPEDGYIASGGSDLFFAGNERVVQRGACIGVHSWNDDDDPTPPTQLPRDHIGHKVYLDYLSSLGHPEDFYWFTVAAAPYDGMHYMSEAEIARYSMATEFEGDRAWNPGNCEDQANTLHRTYIVQ